MLEGKVACSHLPAAQPHQPTKEEMSAITSAHHRPQHQHWEPAQPDTRSCTGTQETSHQYHPQPSPGSSFWVSDELQIWPQQDLRETTWVSLTTAGLSMGPDPTLGCGPLVTNA